MLSRPTLIAALAVMLSLTGCLTTSQTPDSSKLRVGICPNSAPYASRQKDSSISGIEADMARKLAADLGRRAVLVSTRWDSLFDDLERGRFDIIMSGTTITPARQVRADFATPYMASGLASLVRAEDRNRFVISPVGALGSTKIGVSKGTTADIHVRKRFGSDQLTTYKSTGAAVSALIKGKINAVVLDIPIAIYLGARHEADGIILIPHALATEYLAWAVSKDNPVLLDEINTILSGWRKDGTLDGFLQRWIPRYDLFALEEASPSK